MEEEEEEEEEEKKRRRSSTTTSLVHVLYYILLLLLLLTKFFIIKKILLYSILLMNTRICILCKNGNNLSNLCSNFNLKQSILMWLEDNLRTSGYMELSRAQYSLSETSEPEPAGGGTEPTASRSPAVRTVSFDVQDAEEGYAFDNPISAHTLPVESSPSKKLSGNKMASFHISKSKSKRGSTKRRRRSSIQNTNVNNEACVLITISVLTIVALVTFFVSVPPEFPKQVLLWLETNRNYGIPMLIGTLCIAIPIFLPVSKIVYLALGYLYGFWIGWFSAMFGVLLGYILTFLLGRFVCARWMKDYVEMRGTQYFSRKMWLAMRQMLEKDGAYATFVVRFLPLPSNLVCYAMAQTDLKLRHYVLGSLMKAPIASTPVYIWLGTTAEDGVDGIVNGDLESVWISVGFSALFLLFFFIGVHFLKKSINKKFMRRVRSMSRKISSTNAEEEI